MSLVVSVLACGSLACGSIDTLRVAPRSEVEHEPTQVALEPPLTPTPDPEPGAPVDLTPTSELLTLLPRDGVISDPEALELQANGTLASLKLQQVPIASCVGTTYAMGATLETGTRLSTSFTFTSEARMSSLKLWLSRRGTPTGPILVDVHADDAGAPAQEALYSSERVLAQEVRNNEGVRPVGEIVTFTFPQAFTVSATQTLHFVLHGDDGYVADYTNAVSWKNDVDGQCSEFGPMLRLLSDGWRDLRGNGYAYRTEIHLQHDAFSDELPSLAYRVALDAPVTFDFSTLTADENPDGESGALRYSIGVPDANGSTDWLLLGGTMDAARGLGHATADAVLVRVAFDSVDGTRDATLGKIGVTYSR